MRKITKLKITIMTKFYKKITALSVALGLLLLNTPSAFAAFIDVSSYNRNFEAITFLQENGIINGYSDGTFKPFKSVNRAEFLKIIIEGSDIVTDVTAATAFPDIPENVWYTPYVKKAYKEGWINGYGDGTFKPDQTINKVEALKILGKAQGWQIPTQVTEELFTDTESNAWYSGYLKYAKDRNYLEETGTVYLPTAAMTRGQISEIIYRSLTYDVSNIPEEVSEETTDVEDPISTSEDYKFFDGISLESALPETFYKNEIYVLKGALTNNTNDQEITAIIENIQTGSRQIFIEKVDANNFELPIIFSDSGTYKIGLIPGSQGNSKGLQVMVSSITIKTGTSQTAPSQATSLAISFEDETSKLNYKAEPNLFKKITFTQGQKAKTFISRQNLSSIPLIYRSFKEFNEGQINVYIETAKINSANPLTLSSDYTKSSSLAFTAAQHTFDMINESHISTNAPDTKTGTGLISFTGTAKTDIQTKAYIIKPDGFTDTSKLTTSDSTGEYFGTPIIKSGGQFSFSYNADKAGRYVIAIDNKGGEPIFSHPIYIGDKIPLIPDFFDLNDREFFDDTFNLTNSRTQLLNLINDTRESYGLAALALAPDLTLLAQNHADDMAEKNYFAHVNLDSKTPDQRRLEAGITTPVGENIAKDTSIEFGHYSLMRSPSHRINILKEDWERVGLGITEKDGYLYIVEEFSTNDFTAADLDSFKFELFAEINNTRSSNSLETLTYSPDIENASEYINDNIKNNSSNFTQELFQEALGNNNITGNSEVTTVTAGSWSETLNSILEDVDTLLEPLWDFIGIDVDTDDEGLLHTIFIINK